MSNTLSKSVVCRTALIGTVRDLRGSRVADAAGRQRMRPRTFSRFEGLPPRCAVCRPRRADGTGQQDDCNAQDVVGGGCVSSGVSCVLAIMATGRRLRWPQPQATFMDHPRPRWALPPPCYCWPGLSRRSPSRRNAPVGGPTEFLIDCLSLAVLRAAARSFDSFRGIRGLGA